jgi:hypothetical protein
VLRALSLCTCCRHYPGAAAGRRRRSSHPAVSTFPDNVVGSACTPSFSRPAQRSLALRPAHSRRHLYVTCYTEGFSHFVTSMTAPVASGWSVRRVGLAPTGKRRLLTAQAKSGRSRTAAFILTTPAEVDRWLEAKRPLDGRASRTSRVRYRRLSNRADRAPSSKPSPVSSQRMAPTISARLAHLQSLGAINPSKKAPSSS